ncbi:MAG: hypothetical protein LCI00_28280 [Chloroflexi bacterium]|nr:hypothetical protein [Chloroflexota bacterium]
MLGVPFVKPPRRFNECLLHQLLNEEKAFSFYRVSGGVQITPLPENLAVWLVKNPFFKTNLENQQKSPKTLLMPKFSLKMTAGGCFPLLIHKHSVKNSIKKVSFHRFENDTFSKLCYTIGDLQER